MVRNMFVLAAAPAAVSRSALRLGVGVRPTGRHSSIVGRAASGTPAWHRHRRYTGALGARNLPERSKACSPVALLGPSSVWRAAGCKPAIFSFRERRFTGGIRQRPCMRAALGAGSMSGWRVIRQPHSSLRAATHINGRWQYLQVESMTH